MSKESYARGFAKAAEARGIDPFELYKIACAIAANEKQGQILPQAISYFAPYRKEDAKKTMQTQARMAAGRQPVISARRPNSGVVRTGNEVRIGGGAPVSRVPDSAITAYKPWEDKKWLAANKVNPGTPNPGANTESSKMLARRMYEMEIGNLLRSAKSKGMTIAPSQISGIKTQLAGIRGGKYTSDQIYGMLDGWKKSMSGAGTPVAKSTPAAGGKITGYRDRIARNLIPPSLSPKS